MKPDDSASKPSSVRRELIEGEISGKIIGAFFLVYNTLGFGFLERVYERAMYVALKNRSVKVERQVMFDVYFEGELVGRHRADLLVERRVVVEIKATHTLPNASKRQLLNYLTALNLELGLVLHFGPTAQYYRVLGRKKASSAGIDPGQSG